MVELRRLVKTAEAVVRESRDRQPTPPPPAPQRPGWVYQLVVTVLAAANQPLRPQEVIHQAERVHGYQVAPSSIRNCLREAALRDDSSIERLGYGRYRLRK